MIRPLWTLGEVVTVSGGRLDLPSEGMSGTDDGLAAIISGVSIDTRTLQPGDLFVPLADIRDGHDFVAAAFERGAAAALVRENYARRPTDRVLIRVDDPLRALERLGMAARARLSDKARVVAVTGSAGKTGTKEMLRACLKVCASSPEKVHAPEKSFNNHWGVPLTLARMPADTEFAVLEIGMNHAGEIRPLTRIVRPHIAIVTNVLPVHVGNFEDGEIGVANAKAEIFEGLEAPAAGSNGPAAMPHAAANADVARTLQHLSPPPSGEGDHAERAEPPKPTAIILRDNPHYELLRAAALKCGAEVQSFGLHRDSGVCLDGPSGEQADGTQHVSAWSHRAGRRIDFDLGMLGQHLAINSLAVVAALEALGCEVTRAASALASVRSAAGRGAREILGAPGKQILLLDESYNANPASMAAALANLTTTGSSRRRIAIMGDMLELGADSVRYHVGLGDAAGRADLVLCCGENMRHLYDALPSDKQGAWAPSSADLIPHVLAALRPGDAVMVKGSLGSRMAPIVEAIRKHFAGG